MRLLHLSALLCTLCLFALATASAAAQPGQEDAPRRVQNGPVQTALRHANHAPRQTYDNPLPRQQAPGQATGVPHPSQSADVGLWLSQQLHRPVRPSQVLLAPDAATLQGCTIAHARRTPTGATAFSLRCPAPALPHLVLLDLSSTDIAAIHPPVAGECARQHTAQGGPHPPSFGECGVNQTLASPPAPSPNIVRAGAALRADWRTEFIHARLPVVALDSGAAGAAIRVRIPQTNRIVRARILSASTVALIAPGV